MKKVLVFSSLIFLLLGCGTSTKSNNSDDLLSDYSSTFVDTTNTNYSGDAIKVSISSDQKTIIMNIKDAGDWGSYYVGYTASNKIQDNPIDGVTLYKDFTLSCSKTSETNLSINYYCVRILDYNGYLYQDASGMGNYLAVFKNTPTYLYEKSFLSNTAYVMGEFLYKDSKIIYNPYKKAKTINFTDSFNN